MILQHSISICKLWRWSSPPNLYLFRPFVAYQPHCCRIRAFGSAVSASKVVETNTNETFFAEESVSWTSLGVSESLSRALSSSGLHRPSLIQVFCISFLLNFGHYRKLWLKIESFWFLWLNMNSLNCVMLIISYTLHSGVDISGKILPTIKVCD